MDWNWLVDDQPGSPKHNMAVDTARLAALSDNCHSQPTVRIYQWDRPSVSIGRLQREDAVRRIYPGLPIVRRPTGGRAVLHGNDLTISVAVRLEWLPPECRTVLSSYRLIMDNLIAAFTAVGIPADYGLQQVRGQNEIANCFDLSAGCDLVDCRTGVKLVGSAQRREHGALLQQMSLADGVISDHAVFLAYLRQEFGQTFRIKSWVD